MDFEGGVVWCSIMIMIESCGCAGWGGKMDGYGMKRSVL